MLKCCVVGLGKQAQSDHIPSIVESKDFHLVGVYDVDISAVDFVSQATCSIPAYSLDEVVALSPDVVIVSVPHDQYLPIIRRMANEGIHIIKEKPFAISIS